MNILKEALESGFNGDYIDVEDVNDYMALYGNSHEFKWKSRDSYIAGCSSGIVEYKGVEFYFYIRDGKIHVELN